MDLSLIPQPSCESRVAIAKKVMGARSHELGFIPRSVLLDSAKNNSLLVIDDVCFVHFKLRKDEQTTIYEIGVMPGQERQGYGRRLLNQVRLISIKRGKKCMIAKCPEDLPSNDFYAHVGFSLISVQRGKKRKLNVWELML